MARAKADRTAIDGIFSDYCERRIPPQHRRYARLEYRVRGNVVTVIERHAPLMGKGDWSIIPLAQFRRGPSGHWTLFCADRNNRWHRYTLAKPERDLRLLLAHVDKDPTGIFWG